MGGRGGGREGKGRGREARIRYGERQDRGPEGQEHEWKYVATKVGLGVGWGESLGSLRDLGWGRLLGLSVGDLSQNAQQ